MHSQTDRQTDQIHHILVTGNFHQKFYLSVLYSSCLPHFFLVKEYLRYYNLNKRNFENIQYLSSNISIGQVLSDVEKKQMPNSSSLNKKTSNIVGNFKFFLKASILLAGK